MSVVLAIVMFGLLLLNFFIGYLAGANQKKNNKQLYEAWSKGYHRGFDMNKDEAPVFSRSINPYSSTVKYYGNEDPKPVKPPGDDPRAGHEIPGMPG